MFIPPCETRFSRFYFSKSNYPHHHHYPKCFFSSGRCSLYLLYPHRLLLHRLYHHFVVNLLDLVYLVNLRRFSLNFGIEKYLPVCIALAHLIKGVICDP